MSLEVIEKKSPLLYTPKSGTLMPVEANHKGRDEVELLFQPRQALEGIHPPDNAVQSKQLGHFPVHWHFVNIETDCVVSQPVADVQEIAGAAADIQNPFAPSEIQLQVAHAPQILIHPLG